MGLMAQEYVDRGLALQKVNRIGKVSGNINKPTSKTFSQKKNKLIAEAGLAQLRSIKYSDRLEAMARVVTDSVDNYDGLALRQTRGWRMKKLFHGVIITDCGDRLDICVTDLDVYINGAKDQVEAENLGFVGAVDVAVKPPFRKRRTSVGG